MKVKKVFLLICSISILLVGCGKENKEAQNTALTVEESTEKESTKEEAEETDMQDKQQMEDIEQTTSSSESISSFESTSLPTSTPDAAPEKVIANIEFNAADADNYADIIAYDQNNEIVWEYETPQYEPTELSRVSEIGQRDDKYYFIQDGTVVALDVQTGNIVWENSDFGGSGSGMAFGENAIYLCGYYGPDFYAVSYDGETLSKIEQFSPNYFWAYEIELFEEWIVVKMDGGDSDTGKNFFVNRDTFEVAYNDSTIGQTQDDTPSIKERPEGFKDASALCQALPENFSFSSGVGGWDTTLKLSDDGTFVGQYHDSEMGDMGEDYPNGSVYICNFSGKFSSPERIDNYTYRMKLESLEVEKEEGEEISYEEGIRYIYVSEPYGLDNADEFLIYVPGSKISELPEEFVSWIYGASEEYYLSRFGIYNVGGKEGFVGY